MVSKSERIINWQLASNFLKKLLGILKWPLTILLVAFLLRDANLAFLTRIDWNGLLAYITVLRWPAIALVAIFVLRPYIPGLIARVRELGLAGSSFKFGPPEVQSAVSTSQLKEADEAADEPAGETGVVGGTGDDNTVTQLHTALTSAEAQLAYEQTYRKIFGTQLEVLKRLLLHSNGLSPEELEDLFEMHKQRAGKLGYTNFVGFMQFLLDNILVRYDAAAGQYQLTNAGDYFLRYLASQKLVEANKAF